jgi:hypothetical protein
LRKLTGSRRRSARAGARLAATLALAAVLMMVVAATALADGGPSLTDTTSPAAAVAAVGDTITLTQGTYTEDPTNASTTDTWYDCDTNATLLTPVGSCFPVQSGGLTYQVAAADQTRFASNYIVVFESDSLLTVLTPSPTPAIPVAPPPVGPSPPNNSVAPSIVGNTQSGSTLTAVTGVWTNYNSLAYSWSRCQSDDSKCQVVGSGSTYALTSSDVGGVILLKQTATGNGGSASAFSSVVGPVTTPAGVIPPPAPPGAGTQKPGLSGTAQFNSTLKGTAVTLTNNPSYTYQWMRCTASCTPIGGATTTVYTPGAGDVGHKLAFSETGTNGGGSTSVQSPQSATVTAPTETSLQVTPKNIIAGQPVTLIATVTSATGAAPPRGSITFAQSGTPVKGCAALPTQPAGASATITCRTRFGSTPTRLSAAFAPASGALVTGSSSTAGGFVVGRDATTIKVKAPATVTLGHGASFTAAVHAAPGTKGIAPTGTVVFLDAKKAIGGCTATLTSSATAKCSITYRKLGSHSISAEYLGSAAFSAAQSHAHKVKVSVAKPKGFVSALMAWTFHYAPKSTKVATLQVTGLVPGVSVALGCSGHGCPLHHRVWRMKQGQCGKHGSCKGLNLAKALRGRQLGVGAQLTVRMTHRNWLGKYYRFVVRHGRKPKIVTSCLAVGVSQPGIACTPR